MYENFIKEINALDTFLGKEKCFTEAVDAQMKEFRASEFKKADYSALKKHFKFFSIILDCTGTSLENWETVKTNQVSANPDTNIFSRICSEMRNRENNWDVVCAIYYFFAVHCEDERYIQGINTEISLSSHDDTYQKKLKQKIDALTKDLRNEHKKIRNDGSHAKKDGSYAFSGVVKSSVVTAS